MKKTTLLIALLLTFSFAPAFADGSITGPTSGQGPSASVTLDGIRYIWNSFWNGVQDLFSNGKGNTTSGPGYVPPAVQSTTKPKQNSSKKETAPAKKEKKDTKNTKETKTIKPSPRPAADQMVRKMNPKETSVEDLRSKIYRSAYHAVPTK